MTQAAVEDITWSDFDFGMLADNLSGAGLFQRLRTEFERYQEIYAVFQTQTAILQTGPEPLRVIARELKQILEQIVSIASEQNATSICELEIKLCLWERCISKPKLPIGQELLDALVLSAIADARALRKTDAA